MKIKMTIKNDVSSFPDIFNGYFFMIADIKRCVLKKCIFTLLVFFHINIVYAQISDTFSVSFKWKGVERHSYYNSSIDRISFDGARYDESVSDRLPVFERMMPVHSDDVEVFFDVVVTEFEKLPLHESSLVDVELSETPCFSNLLQISRDEACIRFVLLPFFKNDDGVMRVLSCDVSYSVKDVDRRSSASYVENSVLATGRWYKMALSSTDVYKITYSDLSSMGVPLSSINPKNIRIYHNAGGVLPIINQDVRYEDLVEIPIYVQGENDGVFNENDYILFYGRGPVLWQYDNDVFHHVPNPYSDYSYAFLTVDLGEGKRIQNAPKITEQEDESVNVFLDYKIIDNDVVNLNNMGATWFSNDFDAVTTVSYDFNFPNIVRSEKCNMVAALASRNTSSASFNIKANGTSIYNKSLGTFDTQHAYAMVVNSGNVKFNSNSNDIKIDVIYSKSGNSSKCWLDYIEVNAWRELKYTGGLMRFRNPKCLLMDKNYRYQISNANNNIQVWDVSDPVEPQLHELEMESNVASFVTKGRIDNEFVAFNPNACKSVQFVSTVRNQNLHSKYDFDYLIITHPDFYSQAERLKSLHNKIDDLDIEIVTPQLIYNEFSCGAMDITAIRDYVKMLYDKSGRRLRYVLLFGDASYDYKNKSGNVCFVPTYESAASCDVRECLSTDDYFVCLDDREGDMMNTSSSIDIAIGRIPVTNVVDAEAMVNKIEDYAMISVDNAGPWRKVVTFIADDDDTYFLSNCEDMIDVIRENGGEDVDFDKIYLDAYLQVASSSGQRSPECNEAITNRMERGTLLINYVGHAGEIGWADERILTNENIFALRNSPKYHLMLTASCEFGRYDDHTRTSAGEYMFLNHNGGAIALITAARVTYGGPNLDIMERMYKHLFDMEGGEYIAMGDLYVHAKNDMVINTKRYIFIGDPALKLCYPKNEIVMTSINNHDVNVVDTLRALDNVNIKGVVKDVYGNMMHDFNGTLHISVYDKENTYETYGDECRQMSFKLRNSIIYSGKTDVVNGEFSADFTLPKDINYSYGNGTISLYANSDRTDAHGRFSNIIVGGYNTDAEPDTEGPEIKLFIDDEKFVDGSITNENPTLIAYIRDENGINTSGAGIGHDITATLTGATNKTYVLNQYYDAPDTEGDFGSLKYKFYNLNEGEYLLTFKVWDIYNNSNTVKIRFNVVKSKIIMIENVANYPNPMDNYTNFVFDHNQIDSEIDIQVKIYNIVGQLVRTIREHRGGGSLRNNPIKWDGASDNGVNLPAGIYVYYVTVTNSQNETLSGCSKLVIR